MAKKSATPADWNMSQAIRDYLTANPKATARETQDALMVQNPALNHNSFGVSFYTTKKKLGLSNGGTIRGGRGTRAVVRQKSMGAARVDLEQLQATARFINHVGGAEAAIEAIKQVQAVQID